MRTGGHTGPSLIISVLDGKLWTLSHAFPGIGIDPSDIGLWVPGTASNTETSGSISISSGAASSAYFVGQIGKHIRTGRAI